MIILPSLDNVNYTVWMIHHVNQDNVEKLKKLDPDRDIFIWDDAVLSQYSAIKQLLEFRNILGVSSNIANTATAQWDKETFVEYEPTPVSHHRYWDTGLAIGFMTWNHIRELRTLGVEIAAHGYNHLRLEKGLMNGSIQLKKDLNKIFEDFKRELSFRPSIYVYPFNESTFWSDIMLRQNDMQYIGKGRVDAAKTLFNV